MDRDFIFQVMSEKELNIQAKVLETMDKNYPDISDKMRKRLSSTENESRLKIAFVGQHNAGKSTIVSALTKDKSIKISTNVETDDTSSYEWNDVLLYDTPGLYAGVKDTHDASALEAIRNSDVLFFCITSSLFDDLLIENFIDLAYKKSYKNKIILVVNKMSQEDASYEELKNNYLETLNTTLEELGGNLADFPIAFIDAKDYRDGINDDDEELVEISHFDSFIELLNDQIASRGLLAKIGTKCNILLDAISDAIASTSTEFDKNMMVVLNRTARTIRSYKKDMKLEIECLEANLRNSILDISEEVTDKIGVEEITEEYLDEVNRKIEHKAEEYVEIIGDTLNKKMSDMEQDIEEDLASDIGMYVFEGISADEFKARSEYVKDYSDFLEKYGNVAKMIKMGGDKIADMAFVKGASDLSKLASSSGSTMHKIVLNVGHFFGAKFKPWGAIKIANKIGKIAKFAGPVLAIADVAVQVGVKISDEKRREEIKNAKQSAFNSISSVASDIKAEIDKQYALMENEAFDKKIEEINSIKNKMVQEAGDNSELVSLLKKYAEELKSLMANINDVEMYN